MTNSVLVPLLTGFEEIEAVTIIDVLRRAEIPVIVASETAGPVEGSHGISVVATTALADVDAADLAMIALPGGLPGAQHLADHPVVQRLIRDVRAADGYTAAICAAPMALARAGVHEGHAVTSYPGFDRYLAGADYREDSVVTDRKVVTSRGVGTALDFALTLVGLLRGNELEQQLEQRMLVSR
jgi:4-methyl-5(b-hydroxyethyl)-thiazole monophosphate biosynthesis